MDSVLSSDPIVECPTCGLVQRPGRLQPGAAAFCPRCTFQVAARKPGSRSRTIAFALTALILYFPANLLPIVLTEYWGARTQTRIIDGVVAMLAGRAPFIGLLVLTTSIVMPGLKVAGLLFLAVAAEWPRGLWLRKWVFKAIQLVDPWTMLEVTLLSMIASIAELARVATVRPGYGMFAFAGLVVSTLLASLAFDPALVWEGSGAGERFSKRMQSAASGAL